MEYSMTASPTPIRKSAFYSNTNSVWVVTANVPDETHTAAVTNLNERPTMA